MADGFFDNLLGIVKRGALGGLLQDDNELLNTYLPQSLQQGLSDEDRQRFAAQTRNIVSTGLLSRGVDSTERAKQVQTALFGELSQRQAAKQQEQLASLNTAAQDYVQRATAPTVTPEMALSAQDIPAGPTVQRAGLVGMENPNRISEQQANTNALLMAAQKIGVTNPDLAEKFIKQADSMLSLKNRLTETNRLDAAASGMVSNPFAELSQSGGLHPTVKKLADQYAKSFPTLKPDVVDQRYQTLIDMSNKAFERDQGRQDRLSATQQAAADRAESLAFRKQLAEQAQTKMKVAPQFAIEGIQSSDTALKKIDSAMSRLEDPKQAGGIGLKYRFLPEGIAQKFNPEGTELRADLADLGSQKIKDQSGATVTISEEPRLLPFIPLPSDDATTAKKKLIRLRQQMVENGQYFEQVYNPNTGFYALPRAQSAPAPQGTSSGGYTAKEKQ